MALVKSFMIGAFVSFGITFLWPEVKPERPAVVVRTDCYDQKGKPAKQDQASYCINTWGRA